MRLIAAEPSLEKARRREMEVLHLAKRYQKKLE
jgi:hypothetical protein